MERDEMLRLYHQMALIRRLEEAAASLYQEGKIGGFLHLYIGQEAVGCGVVSARRPQDRGDTALSGYATATICLFGDGATNIGYFHEAMNLSVVWELPVLWVCENNQYGMGTSIERASAVPEIRQKAHGYGMPNARVDGMDIVQVRKATEAALKHVRTNGPFLLEAVTYRYRGHSMGDPERYRSHEEVHKWEKNAPIGIFHKYLIKNKHATEAELEQSANQAASEIQKAVRFAEERPAPPHEA